MSTDKMLSLSDHAAWKLVRERIDNGYPMKGIAKELGVTVEHLCEWIFRYKEPRIVQQSIDVRRQPIGPVAKFNGTNAYSLSREARKFHDWRRAQAGAAEARRAMGADRK